MIQRMFVTIDTKKTNYKNVGKINHGDDLILELTVLSDGDMISFNDPMVDLLVKKSDGKMIRQNSGIEHIKPNKFVIEVTKDCVTSPGLSTNQLIINDNGRISTCMFYYTILNSLEEDVIESISSVEVLEQLDEYVIEARERMELLNNDINELEELFGATSDKLVEAENVRNEAEQNRIGSEIVRVNNENDRIEANNIRNQNEIDRSTSELVREQRESERILKEEERCQNESERMIYESTRQQNENIRQSNESIRTSNETDRKIQENRRVTAETNRSNAETTRRNNENSRISNESERQKAMNEMKSLLEDARGFDERVDVIEDEIEEINSSLEDMASDIEELKQGDIDLALGTTSTTAFRGDYGNTAYTHSQTAHAPSNAQKNSDITKSEIEAKLTGNITTHTHSQYEVVKENIPSYWIDHINSKIETIKALQDEGGKDSFSFLVMTDIHHHSNLGKISPLLAEKIMNECDIKYALVLGDVRNRGCWDTKEQCETEWDNIEEMFKPLKGKMLITQGNHDSGYGTGDYNGDGVQDKFVYEFTPSEMYRRVYKQVEKLNAKYDKSGTGYYVDDESVKVRYIMLNSQLNFDGNNGYASYETLDSGIAKYPSMKLFRYTQCQYDFLINALSTIADDDWRVVIASHVPINQSGEMPEYPVMVGVLNAYQTKSSYVGEYVGTAEAGTSISYTNLANPSDADWKDGYRFSSSGESQQGGKTITNYIRCSEGDVVRVKGVTFKDNEDRVATYVSNKTMGNYAYSNATQNSFTRNVVGDVYEFTITRPSNEYIRFSFDTPSIPNNIVITVNEEIKESTNSHGYDYVAVNVNFASAKGKLVSYHGGHVHEDKIMTTCYPSGKLEFPIIITRCDAKEENITDLNNERVKGTITEQSFDVVTVNKRTKTINITKIGAGSDRHTTF